MKFLDEAKVWVKAGDGGDGVIAFRREKFKPLGGPDGGNGGNGGDIVLVVDPSVTTLLDYHHLPHRRAASGRPGHGDLRNGADGGDIELPVPDGTVVSTSDGEVLADLVGVGTRFVVAEGGRGGLGNAALASQRRKAPGFALLGEPGQALDLVLELKTVADIGLVGFPSAGKSSLVAALWAARPKIADYPFTTLEPDLGVVRFRDHEFVLADIPGLIEGAAEGRGLGHRFLRHIERARVLVVLLDLAPVDGRSPEDQEAVLLDELERYRPDLLERPRIVVGSKADVATHSIEGDEVLEISAVTRQGLEVLLGRLGSLIDETRAAEVEREAYVVHRPAEEGFSILREDDGAYRVSGRNAERVVAMADLTNIEALEYVHDRFRRMGVERALARAGAREGDIVRIGGVELEYVEGF